MVELLFSIAVLLFGANYAKWIKVDTGVADAKLTAVDFGNIVAENGNFPKVNATCALPIGGEDVQPEDVPYQTVIRAIEKKDLQWVAVCGGCLVTLKHVFTATNCMFDTNVSFMDMRVVAGTRTSNANEEEMQSENWRNVATYFVHKDYANLKLNRDLSIIELQKPFALQPAVIPVRMLTKELGWRVMPGTICQLTGFGQMDNSTTQAERLTLRLQRVCLRVFSYDKCSWFYDTTYVPPTSFCAGGEVGPCRGQPGSPLICKGVLTGIVSDGLICGNHPGIFADVLTYSTAVSRGVVVPFNKYLAVGNGGREFRPVHLLFISLLLLNCCM